ncbi:MAG: hypothetical protein DRQ88_07355 [Epsilonproteobacteria bacterium]|nr:MAG: hypothetical protein DRQ89_07790 [Campylobacterota bacterium]RLA66216.1 MAG: hypothetical protein DRQ88_07355 [Campylobacterota bacterium]
MKKLPKILALTVSSLLFVFGCAKKPEYESVHKDVKLTNISKSFDTKAEYVYVPMTMGSPREVTEADPFFQGSAKIVKIRFGEQGIEVYQPEKDERFSDNELNNSPVLLIPGTFHAYRCATNNLGECTNREEENNEITWNQKPFFKPNPAGLEVREINPLDLFTVSSSCLRKVATKLVDYEMKKGVINIQLEKTYKASTSYNCIADNYFSGKLHASTFNVRFYYSLVRLKDLASKDYQKVKYPIKDQNKFGFFKETETILDDQFLRGRQKTIHYLNRWNPKNKKLIYHLSDSFDKEENSILKDATYVAIDSINKSLKQANTGIQIELKAPSGKKPGDLRNNMIVLIDEPLANGLLGYGPSVTNPRTGEILQAHTNMYSGVLKSTLRHLWNSMRRLSIERSKIKNSKTTVISEPVASGPAVDNQMNPTIAYKIKGEANALDTLLKENLNHNQLDEKVYLPEKLKEVMKKENSRLNRYAQNNAYALEFFNIAASSKKLLPGVKGLGTDFHNESVLKKWDHLTRSQKKHAENMILPFIYTSTLVHELGHNLGLRHNFSGSVDKKNFYTKEEAQKLGLHTSPSYSSIMDYAGSELNELTKFGKYDIAALRFSMAREIESVDGQIYKLDSTLKSLENVQTKSYMYCSDEHAGTSAKCNRFDEGTNLKEIAESLIKRYENSYDTANLRDDRNSYNIYRMANYISYRYRQFNQMRALFEEWEKYSFFPSPYHGIGCPAAWKEQLGSICDELEDRIHATRMIGNLFLKILKTPDHLCALADIKDAKKTVEHRTLSEIYTKGVMQKTRHLVTSCFHPAVKAAMEKEGKVVRGEVGKFLNSQMDLNPLHPYSSDRAALGIWADKLLAMKALTQRFNEVSGSGGYKNFWDFSYVQPLLKNIVDHMILGEPLAQALPFLDKNGKPYADNMPYTLNLKSVISTADLPYHGLREFLEIPSVGNPPLNKILLKNAKKWETILGGDTLSSTRKNVNYFTVRKKDIGESHTSKIFKTLEIDEIIYMASEKNELAYKMMTTMENFDVLNTYEVKDIQAVIKERVTPAIISQLSDIQKMAIKYPKGLLEMLVTLEERGNEITAQYLIDNFRLPKEASQELEKLYRELGKEGIVELVKIQDTMGVAPVDATDAIKKLYEMDLDVLETYMAGTMHELIAGHMKAITLLPTHVNAL